MASLFETLSHPANYDGYQLQTYLLENIDLIGYCASFYLVMVGKGNTILSWVYTEKAHARREEDLARQLSRLYSWSFVFHAAMSAVLLGCVAVVAPRLQRSLDEKGFYVTACAWNDSLVYLGPVGLALSVITLAKIAELMTTVNYTIRDFLLGKNTAVATDGLRSILVQTHNKINAPHWWYASLVALFFWHTFSVGVSTYPMLACVNAALRSVSNAAMAVEDLSICSKLNKYIESGCKSAEAKRMAQRSLLMKLLGVLPGVNMLLECVVCSSIAIYSSYQNYTASEGCSIIQANVRMCVAMYLSALGLAIYQLHDMQKTKRSVSPAKKSQ